MITELYKIEETHSYFRFPDEINNRIDTLYNDPYFELVEEKIKSSPYQFVELREVVDFSRALKNPTKNPDEEFIYVDIGSIDMARGICNPVVMLGKEATSSRMRKVIIKGSILVSTTRPTRNAICMVPDELAGHICSTGFAVLIPKENIIRKFLFYALRASLSTLQFAKFSSGSGYPAINQEVDLPHILIPKPDKTIQEKIVLKIELIEKSARVCDEKNMNLREEIEATFVRYIDIAINKVETYFFKTGAEGKTLSFYKFPDELDERLHYLFYHPKYEILEELKKKYRLVKLKDIVAEPIIRGEQPEYSEEGITVIKTVDLKNEYIDYENCLKVSEEFFEKYKEQHPEGVLRKGDILIASTGYVSMGKVDIYDRDEPAMVDGHISIVRLKSEYDPYFVAYYLRSHLGQIQFDKWWSGSSGQIEIQPQDLGEFLIPDSSEDGIPLEKQKEIANEITGKLNKLFVMEQQANEKWEEAKKLFEKLVLEGIENEEAAE